MARPKKNTIDYFPHYCIHGSTMFILEQKYGNNGYAFWFKLLEVLGTTEGHIFNCSNTAQWEFLQAKTKLNSDTCNEILLLLAKLEAIDSVMYDDGLIWCQNFVENIKDIYLNRRVEIPSKPDKYKQIPTVDGVSTDDNPQSKVNKSKLIEIYKEIDISFENFKTNYLYKFGKDDDVLKLWEKLKPEDKYQVIKSLEPYFKNTDKKYISSAYNFLDKNIWRDFITSGSNITKSAELEYLAHLPVSK